MVNLMNDAAKYLMILLIAWYTYCSFRFFSVKDETRRKKLCGRQERAIFALHLLGTMVIWLKTGDEKILALYAVEVLFFLCYLSLSRLFYRQLSRPLVNNMCMLLTVGFLMLTRLSFEKALRQFIIVVAAAVLTWMIPFLMERVWQLCRLTWVYALLGAALLIAVRVAGQESFGAQLSLALGGFSFQPSEFVKITFVFFVAAAFYQSVSFRMVCATAAVAAVHVLILVISKDLGSAFLFFVTYLFLVFVATGKWRYLFGGFWGGCGGAFLAYQLFSHVRNRVEAWLNPWADIDNKGYQITQSLFAIGTGGWFGMGLFQGMPGKIPVVEKDFIFSAISEELGGVFALCLIFICLGCFLQFVMIAGRMQALFYKLVAFGLGMVYIIQVFLNVGGVTKFIPSTGVTLPLVSYGGSSVVSTFIIFGVIQGLYILKQSEEEDADEG